MKNALGKKNNLQLYNDNGVLVYKFYRHYQGFWYEYTYDDLGNELIYKDSLGDWHEFTYDNKGNALTYKDSNGFWCESTYDDLGNELTYKSSEGVSKTFDIPEYTMEELTKIVGKEFKIKK